MHVGALDRGICLVRSTVVGVDVLAICLLDDDAMESCSWTL
jgi:hypothetical protein